MGKTLRKVNLGDRVRCDGKRWEVVRNDGFGKIDLRSEEEGRFSTVHISEWGKSVKRIRGKKKELLGWYRG